MNDHQWESLDPADESFVDQALRAGRDELPDEARMRAIEGRLGTALDAEAASPAWWSRSRLYPVVGLAVVALGIRAGITSPSAPAPSVATAATPIVATTEPAATPAPLVSSTSATAVSVETLPTAKAASTQEAKPRPRPATVTAAASGPRDELALLEEASLALEASPVKTLALTDEHLKRFLTPKFAQERERLAVVALVRLGRREDARRRADAFEAAFPDSAHLTRVRELVRP
jgi:glucose/arabinose dehydrogenase